MKNLLRSARPFSREAPGTEGSEPERHTGARRRRIRKWGLWVVIALIAIWLSRTFLVQSYTVSGPAMQGTLLVHDFVLVSKLAYGPRLPITPLGVPFTLNTFAGRKSYLDRPRFRYHRLGGSGRVRPGDVVVFNFPEGDTVLKQQPDQNYYDLVRGYGRRYIQDHYTLLSRPVDREKIYALRSVGLPGDTLEITGGVVYRGGRPQPPPPGLEHQYIVGVNGPFNLARLREMDIDDRFAIVGHQTCLFNLTGEDSLHLSGFSNVTGITRVVTRGADPAVFPHDTADYPWNPDQYGPIVIPRAGMTVRLDTVDIALYRRIIRVYEHHQLQVRGGVIYIDGQPASSYTFQMDYYWMMGDNRDVARDSRYWGFVPADHLIGKAWFISLSYGPGGIRWDRLLKGIH